MKRIGDAEAVYTNKTPVSKSTLEACPDIKYIGVLATGYNVVDVEAAKEKGIPVSNVPAYGTELLPSLPSLFYWSCVTISEPIPNVSWRGSGPEVRIFAFELPSDRTGG